ncbi:hypothetical protein HPB50_002933 [Hyalomma asiaticum]|uniref:Uncharacterized protein n=1 Tax=Hyalomma asiaticum TaxID=266040 RepID=A0ACB7SJE8_HYAAI|nr:hypothetical protein HPB50_002933 [Hyalomma asiaticum]
MTLASQVPAKPNGRLLRLPRQRPFAKFSVGSAAQHPDAGHTPEPLLCILAAPVIVRPTVSEGVPGAAAE